jgi:uncharacterized membrane protein YphA (DoxX/SURF4 family)
MLADRIASPFWSLRLVFGLIPIVAGLDKFFNLITFWPEYVAPQALEVLPVDAQTFMYGVGVVEVIAGLLVLSPAVRFGAYLVGAWLLAVAANLVLGGFYDVAARDVGLAVGAFALGQLAAVYRPYVASRRWARATSTLTPSACVRSASARSSSRRR